VLAGSIIRAFSSIEGHEDIVIPMPNWDNEVLAAIEKWVS